MIKKENYQIRTSKIIDGRAYTNGDVALFTDLPKETQDELIKWIDCNIRARKKPNYRHSSYSLKDIAEHSIHHYISNNQFKDAMLYCGFEPVNPIDLNWCYRISDKSPVFEIDRRGMDLV